MGAKRKEELEKQISKLRGELEDIQEAEDRKIHIPRWQKLIGKCFVYLNSYGSGEQWNLYIRVIGWRDSTDRGLNLIEERFQIDNDGKCDLEIRPSYIYMRQDSPFDTTYRPIPEAEYLCARKLFFREINNPKIIK